jgi:hypothetical protein
VSRSRLFFLTSLASLAALAVACSARSHERRDGASAQEAEPIVGGTVDTTRPDVLLLQDDTVPGFRCTATLIAPNLVVTARHCVGKRADPNASTLCQGDASTNGAQSLPTYDGDVDAAPMFFSDAPGGTLLARAQTIYDDGATTTCAHDLALIGLDRSIAGITPSQIRRTPLAVSDTVLAMGFGWTDRMATINADMRMSRSTTVLALGPVVYTFKPFGDASSTDDSVAAAGGEIAVQGVTMAGDSGGPAFDSSGALAAVVSRGYGDAYYGPGTFTTLAAHLAVIDGALAATGNIPDGGVDTLPDAIAPKDAGPTSPSDPGAGLAMPDAAAAPTGADTGFGRPAPGCSVVRSLSAHDDARAATAAIVAALGLVLARRRRAARA